MWCDVYLKWGSFLKLFCQKSPLDFENMSKDIAGKKKKWHHVNWSLYIYCHTAYHLKKISLISYFGLFFFCSVSVSVALQLYYWRRRRREQTCCGNNKCCGKGFETADIAAQAKDHYSAQPESPGYTHLSFIYRCCWNLRWRWWNIIGSVLLVRRWVWESEHGGFPASVQAGVNS